MTASGESLSLNPDFGIECQGGNCSFERLDSWLNSLCWQLQYMGVEPGMVVASVMPQRWLNALLSFALPRMGCVFFPLDPALPKYHRQQLLLAAKADRLLSDDHGLDPAEAAPADSFPEPELKPDALQLLMATSGTGGQPRVVELTGQNLRSSVLASAARLGLKRNDVWLACLPVYHIGGLAIFLRCAQAGATALLMEGFDPVAVLDALVKQQVSHISLVPAMLHRLLDADRDFHPPATLKVVLLGGAAAPPDLVQAALHQGWPLCPTYGLTETASQVATLYPPPRRWEQGCVGFPLQHTDIRIDQHSGTIKVRGASVAEYARGAGGRQKLMDEQGWLDTGDLGWLDEAGMLYVIGRGDEVLISGGENIHPRMLEQELLRCPGVEDVAVSALADDVWGEALAVLYCGAANLDQVRIWAKQNLQGAFVPKYFFRTDILPRNGMGKLLRDKLKRQVMERFLKQ